MTDFTDEQLHKIIKLVVDKVTDAHYDNTSKDREMFSNTVADIKKDIREMKQTMGGMQKSIDEITPMLNEYKDAKITEEVLAKKGKIVVKWAGALATIGGGVYIIKQFFIWFLK
jgi:tetrahydromethanopterin S-methyltransferase subunit B